MHLRALNILLTLCLALGAGTAQAFQCADEGDRPAVCSVDAYAALEGERMHSFDLGGSLEIQPSRVLEIEIDAFDQNRRRFPKDRLALDFDADACRQLAKVERTDAGRIRISAGTARGRCEIWLWLPGNLNFEWRLDLVIDTRARTGYTEGEADFITKRLYQALLRRDPDPQGLRDTSGAIFNGQLNRRLDEILRSEEFNAKARGAQPSWLLEQIYLGLFNRKPDASAVQGFTRLIGQGRLGELVRDLLDSDEFQDLLLQQQPAAR